MKRLITVKSSAERDKVTKNKECGCCKRPHFFYALNDMFLRLRGTQSIIDRGQSSGGVALILVVFIVALASILVVNLTYSTFLGGRLHNHVERGFQAEYILKSAVNMARAIIKEDDTAEDSAKDPWGAFINGVPVPPEILGLESANTTIEVEIRPEESKVPLRAIVPVQGGEVDIRWRDATLRLFRLLGFDEDNEKDHTGLFPGQVFNAEELVAVLIDYMDDDDESYSAADFARGVESQLPSGTFPNQRIRRIGELSAVPGFTPNRVRRLTPFVTVFGNNRINLNLAPEIVLRSLHEDISEQQVREIINFRDSDEGPFTHQNQRLALEEIIGTEIYQEVATMIGVQSRWFQVLAKADYGGTRYFIRSYISKDDQAELPVIRSVELF